MKRLILLLIAIFMLFGIEKIHETPKNNTVRTWQIKDSKSYAKDMLNAWNDKQFKCLVQLWNKESHWNPKAFNPVKVMHKNAGGIPQILGMSTKLEPTLQIERGLDYIMYRYGTPCVALRFHDRNGWY